MRKLPQPISAYPEPTPRSEVTTAADPDFDPAYGEGQGDKQCFYGGQSFADLRDDMNDRRRRTARATSDRGRFW